MAAEIAFLAGENFNINNLAGSGLGFYGSNFGDSIQVGEYQGTTFITNGAGTVQGPQVDNIKFVNAGSGIINSASSGIGLDYIPNYLASLNIRFTNDTPVRTQNAQVIIYDRVSTSNNASGVSTKVAELIHPSTLQNVQGSGDTQWTTFNGVAGTPTPKSLVSSPGASGLRPNGAGTTDTQHDWYLALSVSPLSVGSKQSFGLMFQVEYL